MGEIAVCLAIENSVIYTESLQQIGQNDAAHAVDRVHTHLETGFFDGIHIHQFQAKYIFNVACVERVVLSIFAQVVHISIGKVILISNSKHFVAVCLGEKFAFMIEQLECIPMAGVVAGGNNDAAGSSRHAHGQLCGWSCGKTYVDDIIATSHQTSAHNLVDHGA